MNDLLCFENFVVGESNQSAHAAACSVVKNPAQNHNPLVIYGADGLGKTHLLNAIALAVQEYNPSSHVSFISAELFIYEMIEAIRRGKMSEFIEKYNNADYLLIDDIEYLTEKKHAKDAFVFTLNALTDKGKQIVIAIDDPPGTDFFATNISTCLRWSGSDMVGIEPPDMKLRVEILKQKGLEAQISLPDDVAVYIASHVKGNNRTLAGCLKAIEALSIIHKRDIDMRFAIEVIEKLSVYL